MPTFNKTDMMNCCRGNHDFDEVDNEAKEGAALICKVCGVTEDEAAPDNDALPDNRQDSANDTVDALMRAEEFISGFEDDETQEGIADILAGLRKAISVERAAPDMLAALKELRAWFGNIHREKRPDLLDRADAAIAKAET
jgi:hypothetical protein